MASAFDYVLVGGGLQNGLIALAVRAQQPAARIAMIERGATVGGNHTWCFHEADVTPDRARWINPLVALRWPGYQVAFPAHARTLDSPYACVTSERLAHRVAEALALPGSCLLTHSVALEVGATRVKVSTATGALLELDAAVVIDARGPDSFATGHTPTTCGWQKFVGQEVVLAAPHGLDRPMLMDATVPQLDGFRFLYLLPLAPDRVLVEDTYFSDRAYLDVSSLRERISAYIAQRGWSVTSVEREEVGVLPLPWKCPAPATSIPLVAGYAGGWFHPVTGYSFPIASRLAELIASRPANQLFGAELAEHTRAHGRQLPFALRLNQMLFKWFAPDNRYHVLERFYRLPEDLIARFYALEMTTLDRARILIGRPPKGLSFRGVLGMEAQ